MHPNSAQLPDPPYSPFAPAAPPQNKIRTMPANKNKNKTNKKLFTSPSFPPLQYFFVHPVGTGGLGVGVCIVYPFIPSPLLANLDYSESLVWFISGSSLELLWYIL